MGDKGPPGQNVNRGRGKVAEAGIWRSVFSGSDGDIRCVERIAQVATEAERRDGGAEVRQHQ